MIHIGSRSSTMALAVTATQAITSRNYEQALCRHDTGRAADCCHHRGVREGNPFHTHSHPNTNSQGWGARPFIFFSLVQTGLPPLKELAKSLTRRVVEDMCYERRRAEAACVD